MRNFLPRPLRRRVNHFFRSRSPARIWELYSEAARWSTTAETFVAGVMPQGSAAGFLEEFAAWRDPGADDTRAYPSYYDVGMQTAASLYALVRATKPRIMVETGVADGASTRVLIEAMHRNGAGRLVSIDIAPGLGDRWDGRGVWSYRQTNGSIQALEQILQELGPIDLFLHDSDHSYRHQFGEYTAAWRALRSGGPLLSDDSEWSNALLDFREREAVPMHCLMDVRKVFSACRKP